MSEVWYQNRSKLAKAVHDAGSVAELARETGVSRGKLNYWMRKLKLQSPRKKGQTKLPGSGTKSSPEQAGVTRSGDEMKIVSETFKMKSGTVVDPRAIVTKDHLMQPEELLELQGLDPERFIVLTAKTNTWNAMAPEGVIEVMAQLTINVRLKLRPEDVISPAEPRPVGWKPKKKVIKRRVGPELIPVFPDPHCPLQEVTLCDAATAWLEEYKPERAVCLGDGMDASAFARHAKNPAKDVSAQESIDSYYELLSSWKGASPNTQLTVLPGNHDWWLRRRVLEMIPALHGLRQAGTDNEVLSMTNLLRLDELEIDMIEPEGEYFDATLTLLDDLVLMHGKATGKYGGAIVEIETWEGGSVGQGHDHKTAIVAVTRRLPDGTEVQRYAISFGTMAKRDLGYNPKRNVGQSFGVIAVHPDGRWHPELAYYDPQRDDVTWRDWRYEG